MIITFFAISIVILSSCNKEDPCPSCFEDVVTCKVNGKEWRSNCISNDPLFGCRAVNCYYYIKDDYGLNLLAGNINPNSGLEINIRNLKLGNNNIKSRSFGYTDMKLLGNCIKIDSLVPNYLNEMNVVKIDTVNYILEGKFAYQVHNFCGDTITISNGYFKTKFLF